MLKQKILSNNMSITARWRVFPADLQNVFSSAWHLCQTRALLRLERTMNLLEGGWGREGGEGRDDGYTYCNRYVH